VKKIRNPHYIFKEIKEELVRIRQYIDELIEQDIKEAKARGEKSQFVKKPPPKPRLVAHHEDHANKN
jgi:hypothetical protein